MTSRAAILKQQFNQSVGLPWQDILPESRIEEILAQEKVLYFSRLKLELTKDKE